MYRLRLHHFIGYCDYGAGPVVIPITGVPEKNLLSNLSQVTDKLYHIINDVSNTPRHERGSNSQL